MQRIDYADEVSKLCDQKLSGEDLVRRFVDVAAKGGAKLMVVRDFVVKRSGLKTSSERQRATGDPVMVGDVIGIFRVFALGDHAATLGEDDSHLNFRVQLSWSEGRVRVRTEVMFNMTFVDL